VLKKTRAYARSHLLVTTSTALVTLLLLFVIFEYTLPKVALFCNPPVAEQTTIDNGIVNNSTEADSAGLPKIGRAHV
jgi:hypothetical protein